jgi:4-diphosphocytidyl-2-C-methyl-D-erythritol kinase
MVRPMKIQVKCPAKINTFLSIGPPDANGWHPLRTIFQAIDLSDELTIEEADADSFTSDVDWLPGDNSITRALSLARDRAAFPKLTIRLLKRIPAQSGLGGGSSDAAGLLRGLSSLYPGRFESSDLQEIALQVGADVPFFLVGGRAKGEGFGDRLTPLEDLHEQFVVVVKPALGCPTPDMYRDLDKVEHPWLDFPSDDSLHNDFELVAPEECHRALHLLGTFDAFDAGLTGSGSAVFGRYDRFSFATTAKELMHGEGFDHVWCVRTLSREESLATRVSH